MKIAFLTYQFGGCAYGIGKYGWYLTRELRRLGFEVDVFTANLRVKKIGPLLHSIRNTLRKLKYYDVVHSNEGAGLLVSHPYMVETFHHDYAQVNEFGYRFFHALENIECRKVQHIITPSIASQNSLLRYGFPLSKISVIYHGVDHAIFKVNHKSREKSRSKLDLSNNFVVINVGRLVKHKGQMTLLRIIRKLPNTCLILVGKGEEEGRINRLRSQLGVQMLQFKDVSDEILVDLYNVSDVYVHTSALEGFGLSVLEAMACGLPIVAYDTADLRYVVGDAGFVVPQGDIKNLSEKIMLLYRDDALRQSMAEKAVERSKLFTWDKSAQEHLRVFKKALNDVPMAFVK